MSSPIPLTVGLASLIVTFFIWFRKHKASTVSLPPGPRPLPLLGNVRDLTTKELWLPAAKWAKQYGYGEQSKRQRKLMHKAFGLPVIPSYYPLLQSETHGFLRRIVASPLNYVAHTRRYAGALTLKVVYGYEPLDYKDKFLSMAEECVDLLANKIASGGGIWPVDIFPVLQHLPTWVPGAGFKIKAAKWKAKMEEFVDQPFEFVKDSIKSGSFKTSFCSTLLEDSATKLSEFDIKWTANSMYSASMDT
ncbi:hypothetical protein C0993_000918, partial [Termitomyces sp. T159_Od127]